MKRTLLEILGGMTVLVLLASFHHQISHLKSENGKVAELRAIVKDAVCKVDAERERETSTGEVLASLDEKLRQLESRLAVTDERSVETKKLRHELDSTRTENERFRTELSRDLSRTRELVDAFHKEVRAVDRSAKAGLYEAKADLRELTRKLAPDPVRLDHRLLAPSVQLNGDDTVGSGTMIFSDLNPSTGRNETYVITSYHVIRNILADTPSARRRGVSVTIYQKSGKTEEFGDMVSHDPTMDGALVKLRTERRFPYVARAMQRRDLSKVHVWKEVYAVGCPLGNDPIPTRGEISSVDNVLNGSNYWMINAPTYFGNSGGAVFMADTCELVGVFSKIYTHGKGTPVVVPHMGLCTPIALVWNWLEKDGYAWVLERSGPHIESTELALPAATPPK